MTAAVMTRPTARTRLVDDAARLADAVAVLGDRDRHARALARWTRGYLRLLSRHIRADGLERAFLEEVIDGLETCLIGLEDDRLPWIPVRARARTFSRRLAEYLELYGAEVLAEPTLEGEALDVALTAPWVLAGATDVERFELLEGASPVARLAWRVGRGAYDRLARSAFSDVR